MSPLETLAVILGAGAIGGIGLLAAFLGAGHLMARLVRDDARDSVTVPEQRLPTRIRADEDDEPREIIDQT